MHGLMRRGRRKPASYSTLNHKNQHPEYSINPAEEIKLSIEVLRNKPHWKERYQEFIETMIYDNRNALEYDDALKILEKISAKVINSLG